LKTVPSAECEAANDIRKGGDWYGLSRLIKVISIPPDFTGSVAWGIPQELFFMYLSKGVDSIWLYDRETRMVFSIAVETFLRKSFIVSEPHHGMKLYCSLKHFNLFNNINGGEYGYQKKRWIVSSHE
jgi:hypothetical protein